MSSSITLSSSVRSNLLALSNATDMSRAQSKLTTGLKASSAIDSAQTYFQAKSLSDRASDFTANKDQMQSAVTTIGAAANGASNIEGLLKRAKGIATAAAKEAGGDNPSSDTIQGYADQYNDVLKQIDKVATDSSYNGVNLLAGGNGMAVKLSDYSTLNVQSKQLDTSEKSLNLQAVTTFGADETARLDSLDTAISTVRNRATELGANSATISTRMDFTKNYIDTLQEGVGKLNLADLNDEGANLVALQTRQQIGIQSLSFAGQQQQSVLSLLR